MKKSLPLVDLHLDLAMNAMEWNRDLRWTVEDIRGSERGLVDKPDRTRGTVSFPALREAGAVLVVATQIARVVDPVDPRPGWHSQFQAWAQTQGQLSWYREMERIRELRMVRTSSDLPSLRPLDEGEAIPYMLSLEGADSIVSMDHLAQAWENGLRALGPAHYGPGVYAHGTDADRDLDDQGLLLLKSMDELGLILDVTHLCDKAFWTALDNFDGPLWASHHLSRSLVSHNRQLSDEMLRVLVDRGALVGIAMDAWMIVPHWIRGESTPKAMGVTLERVVDHLDHFVQAMGHCDFLAIGSDLDGAFGTEQGPEDLDTIADLQKLSGILHGRGYSDQDVANIFGGNALRFLKNALPQ